MQILAFLVIRRGVFIGVLILIIKNIIFPIFALMFAGVFLHRKFHLDLNSLSKIVFYYLIPAIVFVKVYQSDISFELVTQVIYFLLLHTAILFLLASLTTKTFNFDNKLVGSFNNSIILTSQGNYGLPVNSLVFKGDPLAMAIQTIIMTFQNLLTFSFGIFNLQKLERGKREVRLIKNFFKTPVAHAFILATLVKTFNIEIPPMIWIPLKQAADAFLAIALLLLGAQVAYVKINSYLLPLFLSAIIRLLISPLIAYFIILTFGMTGVVAKALFISSSFPASRNSATIALEYKSKPEFAAQAVLVTTLISSITVAVIVYLAGIIF